MDEASAVSGGEKVQRNEPHESKKIMQGLNGRPNNVEKTFESTATAGKRMKICLAVLAGS